MKKTILLQVGLYLSVIAISQTPGVRNSTYININDDGEIFYDIKATPDKGFIAVGTDSVSSSFSKTAIDSKTYSELTFIAKLDSGGNVIWRRSNPVLGHNAAFTSVEIASDGGYVATGYAFVNSPFDTSQLFIQKYSSTGTLLWNRSYGGSQIDKGYGIVKTSWGYAVAGFTGSNDGDVSGNHSPLVADVWLMKTDQEGNIIWKKCYGGGSSDTAYALVQTEDKGFIVAGTSRSNNGDVPGNNGNMDAWIFKTDSLGNLLWSRNYGGSANDGFRSLVLNTDGSVTVTGYTMSTTATNNGNKGSADLWVARISALGNMVWTRGFGGSLGDAGMHISRTQDDNFMVTGYTESNTNDVSGNNGLTDAWLIKVSALGGLIWQKTIGTNKEEFGMAGIVLTESEFVVAGTAQPAVPAGPFDVTDAYISKLGNSNQLKGTLYFDMNLNGVKDVGEVSYSKAIVKATKAGYERSSVPVDGVFQMDVETGSFTTTPVLSLPYYISVPASHPTNFATYFNKDSFSFAIQPLANRQDLTITAAALGVARPGFDVTYKLFYQNVGTMAMSGVQVLFKKDSRLSFISSLPALSSSNGDTLKWDFASLQPQDTGSITIRFNIPPPPTVLISDVLNSLGVITPVAGDLTPSDDSVLLRQEVFGSYDPNDKAENLGGRITLQEVTTADYITYTIRFQNTGNDTAFNVVIRDTLDSKLNWNSFEMVGASHPYSLQISSANRLAWTFSNILLPDSNRNEPASHGYIIYRIRPNTTLSLGDVILNDASIYFDFNLPVATIAAQTLVSDITLPLHLLDFRATYEKPDALLEWSTADELNVDKFIIERGPDPLHFVPVGSVAAKGGSGITNYQFKDGLVNTSGEKFYYRLRMMDIDQKFKYSNIELVQREGKRINELVINPNPVNGRTGFAWINFEKATIVELGVFDMQGRYRQIGKQSISKGFNVVPVDLSGLSNGTYVFQAKAEGKILTTRIVLTR
jgi:uncharacterized repeat protein (TIGR01451 family)